VEYALAASTAIKATDLLFEGVTLSKAAYGKDEVTISGSVTNNSNTRLSSVHFDITLSDCLKSKCITVGQNSVTVYADVPAGQKRAFTSRAMAFENLPEGGRCNKELEIRHRGNYSRFTWRLNGWREVLG
jgi:hypothetical protein